MDFQSRLIQLRAEDTKTDDARLIPLTHELTELFKDLHKVRYLYLDEQKVFLVKGGQSDQLRLHLMEHVVEREF